MLHSTEYKIDDAKIVVDYAHVPLKEDLKPTDKRSIAIYLGGLPHNPAQNTGGDPQRNCLVADLLQGTASDLIVLKPEGLTASAYDNAAPENLLHSKAFRDLCRAKELICNKRDIP